MESLTEKKVNYIDIDETIARTPASSDYTLSEPIDENIMKRAALTENEKVQVVNINNGSRIETYVIKGEAGSGIFALIGPAARHAQVGDDLFILSWAHIDPSVEDLEPIIVEL